ncbi:hypothetical protein [Psychroserpens algicola]|uniref:Uncharacterized protein n=1 Tax=Psychroserpens algicola TaxID=1719034 RepID=A0ABT0H567_9FLAO|nr:hypothetical protein [Psychroserpens algicola]MCK8479511.1 hypothetical protein [Psychroserpens algicola]
MTISKEDAIKHAQSKDNQDLLAKYRKEAANKQPVLANAYDLVYKAYKRQYAKTGNDILIIIANGWYFPTPEVHLYFEAHAGNYKLMQNNSSQYFNMVTYHTAQWTSGLGLETTPETISIQDAYGFHTIKVESFI